MRMADFFCKHRLLRGVRGENLQTAVRLNRTKEQKMQAETFEWKNSQGLRMHGLDWRTPDPQAVFALVHGQGEHSGRYYQLANWFTARRIARYTTWLGHPARVFNVGSYRRARIGAGQHGGPAQGSSRGH
jgi:hypothetical protein